MYKTGDNTRPEGKANIYFCCHPDDFDKYFNTISNEIFLSHNCAIWFIDKDENRNEEFFESLKMMRLFVMPITSNLLCTTNHALDTDFRFAMENGIPILPLMQEPELIDIFNAKCGDLHFLDKTNQDITAISYETKLKKYLSNILVDDDTTKKIRDSFDAYIFLSYRKKDRKYANELLRNIHSNKECRNIAVWYDEFLTPGENFRENIENLMDSCKIFTLLVTPRISEQVEDKKGRRKDNFVITDELPMALKKKSENKLSILAVEMEKTEPNIIKQLNLSSYVTFGTVAYQRQLNDAISTIPTTVNDSAQQSFFIGLAYLDGIDVEINRELAIELITTAAEKGFEPALNKLANIYYYGEGVNPDRNKAFQIYQQLCSLYEHDFRNTGSEEYARKWIDTHCIMGDILLKEKNFPKAESHFISLKRICKKLSSPSIFTWQGRALLHGSKKCLYALYGKAVAHMGLAQVYTANGNTDAAEDNYCNSIYALEDYEDCLFDHNQKESLDSESFWLCYAEAYLGTEKPEKALEIAENLRKKFSSSRTNNIFVAACTEVVKKLIQQKQYSEAESICHRAEDAINGTPKLENNTKWLLLARISSLSGEIHLAKDRDNYIASEKSGYTDLLLEITDTDIGKMILNPGYKETDTYKNAQKYSESAKNFFLIALALIKDQLNPPTFEIIRILFDCFEGLGEIAEMNLVFYDAISNYEQLCDISHQAPIFFDNDLKLRYRIKIIHEKLAKLYKLLNNPEKQLLHLKEAAALLGESTVSPIEWNLLLTKVYSLRNEITNVKTNGKVPQIPKKTENYNSNSLESLVVWFDNILILLDEAIKKRIANQLALSNNTQSNVFVEPSIITTTEHLADSFSALAIKGSQKEALHCLEIAVKLYDVLITHSFTKYELEQKKKWLCAQINVISKDD